MTILHQLQQFCRQHCHEQSVVVAYSGGVDSHVLLHAVKSLQVQGMPITVKAVHVNHHLSAQADSWAQHCQQVCDALDIPLLQLNVHIDKQADESLEAMARDARYTAFAQHLPANSLVMTAHHQDDQAETLLLQLLRGAGPKGLQAMPWSREYLGLTILRPLLHTSQQTIMQYAEDHHLQWVEDNSNDDIAFQRNLLRKTLLPVLEKEWPSAVATMARSAEYFAEAQQCVEALAALDYENVTTRVRPQLCLSIERLQVLSKVRQKQVIRYWLQEGGFALPSAVKLEHIFTDVMAAKDDAMPCVAWPGVEVRRYRDRLYANKPLEHFDATSTFTWDWRGSLLLPAEMGSLTASETVGQGIKRSEISGLLEVRFRQGGEKVYLSNRLGGHSLKQLFQEWGVPTWQRDRIPLLYHHNQLVAVVGYCVCEGFAANTDEPGLLIDQYSH